MNSQKMPLKNSLCLLLAATIWGIAFVAQSVGMEYVGPFTFNGVRSLIGAAVLVPVIFLLNRSKDTASAAADPSTSTTTSSPYKTRDLWIGGIACGIALFAASNFQQFGIKYTTVGKAGFITACYIVIVPIIGFFLKKKFSPFIWAAVVMALTRKHFQSRHLEAHEPLDASAGQIRLATMLAARRIDPAPDALVVALRRASGAQQAELRVRPRPVAHAGEGRAVPVALRPDEADGLIGEPPCLHGLDALRQQRVGDP